MKNLLYRSRVFVMREPQAVFAKIGQSIFVGLLILSIYLGIGSDDTATGIGNVAGCNFFILVGLFMNWMFGSILTF